MVDSVVGWKDSIEAKQDPILCVVDDLMAGVENEYWKKLQILVEEIIWSTEFKENNLPVNKIKIPKIPDSIDIWLVSLEVDNDITTLNTAVDTRIQNEELLNEYRKKEFVTLQEEIELKLAEIKVIKYELDELKKNWWELLDNTEVAEYLHDKYPVYYARYIDTKKSIIVHWVEKKAKEYKEFYANIPPVSYIYNAIQKRANPLEINA